MKSAMSNFHPMPKRFMVWDKFEHRFHEIYSEKGGKQGIFDIWDLEWLLGRFDQCESVIVQSTNLFDKDRKEIWEGSIVRGQVFDDPRTRIVGVVVYRQQEFLIVNSEETHSESLFKFYEKEIEVIGHVLSNPELLQEEE